MHTRVHIYTPYGSSALAHEIAAELRASQVDVTGPSEDLPTAAVNALVVMLPDTPSTRRDNDLEQRLLPWAEILVPVVSGSSAAPSFPDLSQLRAGRIGVLQTARRIALIARFGGATLADLFRLESTAARWQEESQPGALLARGARVDADLRTVSAAAGLASTEAAAYVKAGLVRRRQRNRRFLTVAVAVALVLAAGTEVATVQRVRAIQATTAALQRAAEADSTRLARLALQTRGIDPDLPWLLAQQAMDQAHTPQALDAARRVLTTTPVHRSIALPRLPNALSTDPGSNTIAVQYVDGSVDLRSGANGRLLRTFPAGTGSASLFPGGKVILLGDTFVDPASGQTLRRMDPGWAFRGWAGPTSALVRAGGMLAVLDVTTGDLRPTAVPLSPASGPWSLAAGAAVASIIDGDTLISVDLATTQTSTATLATGARDVATSDDGSRVFVARLGGRSQEFTRSAGLLKGEDSPGSGLAVVVVGSSWVLAGAEGEVQWVTAGESSVAFEYAAHRGPVAGLGALSGGRTATIGADHYLRLWEPLPEQVSYPIPGTPELLFDAFNLSMASNRVAARSMLALSPDGDRLSYLLNATSSLGLLDPATLHPMSDPVHLIQVTVNYLPLPSGRAAFFGASGQTGVIDLAGRSVVWERKLDNLAGSALIGTASPDGERLAVAVPSGVMSYGRSDGPVITRFEGTATPVAVMIDHDGHAGAVTSTGDWYRESSPLIRLPVAGSPVVIAELAPDGTLVVLQRNGSLSRYADGQLRPFAQTDLNLDAFALRFSADGQLVAVLGTQRTVVLSGQSGTPVMDLFPVGLDGSVVRDVALTAAAVWEIRADGGVVKRPVLDADAVAAGIATDLPRSITRQEVQALASAVDSIGQH